MSDLDLAGLNEHERRNRDNWNADAPAWVQLGRRGWSSVEPSWGMFGVPEAEVGILPDVEGLDAIELGCGTASGTRRPRRDPFFVARSWARRWPYEDVWHARKL